MQVKLLTYILRLFIRYSVANVWNQNIINYQNNEIWNLNTRWKFGLFNLFINRGKWRHIDLNFSPFLLLTCLSCYVWNRLLTKYDLFSGFGYGHPNLHPFMLNPGWLDMAYMNYVFPDCFRQQPHNPPFPKGEYRYVFDFSNVFYVRYRFSRRINSFKMLIVAC